MKTVVTYNSVFVLISCYQRFFVTIFIFEIFKKKLKMRTVCSTTPLTSTLERFLQARNPTVSAQCKVSSDLDSDIH